ncbi:tyrosine-type recombinase/integrase [Pandoraea pnomenusa]|nr:tyrosine-type recombinase/integrase [Pandoraea pnomenusa]
MTASPIVAMPAMVRMVQDNYDLAIFLLDTGCRYSEAANIPWSSIDIENQTINLFRSKVQNESILHMTQRLYEVMCRRANSRSASDRHVFKNKQGESRGYSTNAFKKAFVRAGLNTPTMVKERGGKVIHHFCHVLVLHVLRVVRDCDVPNHPG